MISAVIFDLDGTIADNIDNIYSAYKFALTELNIEYDDTLKSMMGKGLNEIAELMNIRDKELFLSMYKKGLLMNKEKIKDGMYELISLLFSKNIPIAIATSKFKETTIKLLKQFNLLDKFSVIITAESVDKLKPSAEPIARACELLGISSDKSVLYIGDAKNDMLAAINADVTPIGVTWGIFGERICEIDNVTCFKNVEDLKNCLLNKIS